MTCPSARALIAAAARRFDKDLLRLRSATWLACGHDPHLAEMIGAAQLAATRSDSHGWRLTAPTPGGGIVQVWIEGDTLVAQLLQPTLSALRRLPLPPHLRRFPAPQTGLRPC